MAETHAINVRADDRVSSFEETTDADLFALTRLRRRELSSARLRAKYGETVRYCVRPRGDRAEALEREFCGVHPAVGRSIRRNAIKVLERERKAVPIKFAKPPSPHTRYITQATHDRLLTFQNNTCYLCNRVFTDDDFATQDHVHPRAHGGKDSGNILLAHLHCNNIKGDRLPKPEERAYLATIRGMFAALPAPVAPSQGAGELRKRAKFKRAMFVAKIKRLTKAFFRKLWPL